MGKKLVMAALLGCLGWGGAVHGVELRLCARGVSYEPGQEVLETRQVRLVLQGPDPGDFRNMLAHAVIHQRLWPELKAADVGVTPFDPLICGTQDTVNLRLSYAPADLALLQEESHRGPGEQQALTQLSAQASSQPGGASRQTPEPGVSASATKAAVVQLYYATNRAGTGQQRAAQAFSAQRGSTLLQGRVEVSIPASHQLGHMESPSILRFEWSAQPEQHVLLKSAYTPLNASAWAKEVQTQGRAFHQGGVLLFVHGYNCTFEDAARRAGQFAYDLAFAGPVVLFSWPSAGSELSYRADEAQAGSAWRPLADVLEQLTGAQDSPVPVYLVAHSMGSRVLTQALAEFFERHPGAERAIKHVVLAAPDIGVTEFNKHWIYQLQSSHRPPFTLYASSADKPLALSAKFHEEKRLGQGGDDIFVTPGMDSIDATPVTQEWFGLAHSYFGAQRTVLNDIYLLINRGLPPYQRPGLGKAKNQQSWVFKP